MEGPYTDERDRHARMIDRLVAKRDQLSTDLDLARRENERLQGALEFIARKTCGGLCQLGAEGKHAFLEDIEARCDQEGFDVLGEFDRRPAPPSPTA